jgi:hypothetical protein
MSDVGEFGAGIDSVEDLISGEADVKPKNKKKEVEEEPSDIPDSGGTIVLGKEKFSALLTTMLFFKNDCTDFIINGGNVSQFTDDKKYILSSDISELVGNLNLPISGIAIKFGLIELLRRQNVNVNLITDDNFYRFRDSVSEYVFKMPMHSHMKNSFITSSKAAHLMRPDYSKRIFTYKFDKKLLDRLQSASKALESATLYVMFEGQKANICIKPLDASDHTAVKLVTIDEELEDTSINKKFMSCWITSFLNFINCGAMEIEASIYRRKADEDVQVDDERLVVLLTAGINVPESDIRINLQSIYNCPLSDRQTKK